MPDARHSQTFTFAMRADVMRQIHTSGLTSVILEVRSPAAFGLVRAPVAAGRNVACLLGDTTKATAGSRDMESATDPANAKVTRSAIGS